MTTLRSLLWGWLSLCLLTACEPGNSLKSFSGRQLRAALRPMTDTTAIFVPRSVQVRVEH
jgi:hypothetical protein